MRLLGIDFTSRPTRRKPITVATGRLINRQLHVTSLRLLTDFASFDALLAEPGPWLAACDFPFGLPRELVSTLSWPTDWPALMQHLQSLDRPSLRSIFKAFCDARPAGNKFAHRAADLLARSSSSMKWVNPPVAYMLLEGATRLQRANITVPGMQQGSPDKVALEGYPARLARSVIGQASYKSDERAKQTPTRQNHRQAIIEALLAGNTPLGIPVVFTDDADQLRCLEDGTADALDAALCLVQAAWASQQPAYGLPATIDPIEGWIVTVSPSAASS